MSRKPTSDYVVGEYVLSEAQLSGLLYYVAGRVSWPFMKAGMYGPFPATDVSIIIEEIIRNEAYLYVGRR